MMNDITKLGMTTTVDSVVRGGITTGMMKRLIAGQSTYQIVQWLNKQKRSSGLDVHHIYDEVYDLYKEELHAL